MPEIDSIVGYSPERMPEAMDLMNEHDINALIFRDMISGVHSELLELYKANFVEGAINKHSYPSEVTNALQALGFSMKHFSRQPLDVAMWPDKTIQHTTVELVEKSRGIGWHTDVVGTDGVDELYLPYGYSFSLNLAGRAIFRVLKDRIELPIPGRSLNAQQLDVLASKAALEDIGDANILEGYLEPGDVFCWRQPLAHQVTVLDEERHAIIFIQEDYVIASS